ncbi:hypothetical protein BDW22DRAFT_813135 [Trametopsis cervina]|nr:hypothetical protein BDW22DRAFT_813135 [Trametopsis cervina]
MEPESLSIPAPHQHRRIPHAEIYFVIMAYLHPTDLLRLSRVSKWFRAMLMSRSSKCMWAAARKNVDGLPAPPSVVSEPKYAALVFEQTCFGCGSTHAVRVSFALGIRFCTTCWDTHVVDGLYLQRLYQGLTSEDLVFALLPYIPAKCVNLSRDPMEYRKYLYAEFLQVVQVITAAPNISANEYVNERVQLVQTMQKHDAEVTEWQAMCKIRKRQEDERISEERHTSIEQKLCSLGFTPAQFPTTADDHWKRLVYQPEALTPRIWRLIRRQLIALIAAEPAKRRARIQERIYEVAIIFREYGRTPTQSQLPEMPLWLLVKEKAIHDALCADGGHTPMTLTRFLKVSFNIRFAHYLTVINSLLKSIQHDAGGVRTVISDLYLATSIFPCYYCPQAAPVSTYGWYDLVEHVRCVHLRDRNVILHADALRTASGETSRAVLRALGLSASTSYKDLTGRVVCLCGKVGFPQPTTFANLLRHIEEEQVPDQGEAYRRGVSMTDEGEAQAVSQHDHGLSHAAMFVKLLNHQEMSQMAEPFVW